MTENAIDTRDMLAVHQVFRTEFAALPGLIADVPTGDLERAAVVGAHARLLLTMLQSHHHSEDLNLWPVIRARVPEHQGLVGTLEGQHAEVHALVETALTATDAWMAMADADAGARAGRAIAEMSVALNEHLGQEEADLLPIAQQVMTGAEYFEVGAHSRAGLSQQDLTIALGLIEDVATPDQWDVIYGDLPPEGRAGWEQFGRPMYRGYRSQLLGS
jgi:hypothetical protein